jgi:hypothetical protein
MRSQKKIEKHIAAIAFGYFACNFIKITALFV